MIVVEPLAAASKVGAASDPELTVVGKWTAYGRSGIVKGTEPGSFNFLSDVAVDGAGNLYVADCRYTK
ncbi:hypothetical protein ACFSTH_16580 [Paenibacillus yanchengensis]